MTKTRLLLATPILLTALSAVPASASTTTASLQVSATAAAACTLTTTPVAFGTLSATAATTATGTISVNCTNGDALTIALDGGANGSSGQRRLANGTNYLNYDLYQPNSGNTGESSPATAWGDGTGLGSIYSVSSTGAAQNLVVYGSVPSGQSLYVGNYTDTVTVTLTY